MLLVQLWSDCINVEIFVSSVLSFLLTFVIFTITEKKTAIYQTNGSTYQHFVDAFAEFFNWLMISSFFCIPAKSSMEWHLWSIFCAMTLITSDRDGYLHQFQFPFFVDRNDRSGNFPLYESQYPVKIRNPDIFDSDYGK